MGRNLLLGNGINMHLDVKGMQLDKIANRFFESLIISSDFFELMFHVKFTSELCNEFRSKTSKLGIESLAFKVYEYLENRISPIYDNDRLRILDAIICCAMTAIFYENDVQLGNHWNHANLPDFSRYQHIYTLNYYEFWDEEGRCEYLHGKYIMEDWKHDGKPVMHYSDERYVGYPGYKEIVEKMACKYNMQKLNTAMLIFSPEFHSKLEMAYLGGYPSNKLKPAADIFPMEVPKLYKELDSVNEIEIFGMSPYGDDDLIKKINRMDKVTVYVYNLKNSHEADVWKKKLTCDYKLKDSSDIFF